MYRLIDCQTWNDPWFEGLDPNGKLFFLYLIANPRSTSCGAFEITIRKMAFETGLTEEQVDGYLTAMAPRVMWWPEHQVVWLRNFYRRQGNQNDKTRINARKLVAALPIAVQREIAKAYPELVPDADTLSIPYPYPVHQKNNEKENEYEYENEHENEGESEGEIAPAAPVVESPPARAKPRKRIPDDWALTDELREYAVDHGIPALQVDELAAEFKRYWQGDGRPKADWDLTFMTRVRDQAGRYAARGSPNGTKPGAQGEDPNRWFRAAERYGDGRGP